MFNRIQQVPIHYITGAVAVITLLYGIYALSTSNTGNNIGLTFITTGIIALTVTGYIVNCDRRCRANFQSIIDHGHLTGPYRSLNRRVSSQQMNLWIDATPAQRARSLEYSFQSIGNIAGIPPHHPMVLRYAINEYINHTM